MLGRVFHLGFSRILTALSSLIIFSIAARYLTIEDYSEYRQFFLFYDLILPLVTIGIPGTIAYVLARTDDIFGSSSKSLLLIYSFFFSCLVVCLLVTFLFSIEHDFSDLQLMIPVALFFTIPIQLFSSVFVYIKETKLLSIITILYALLLVLFSYIQLKFKTDAFFLVFVRVLALISLASLLILFFYKKYKVKISFKNFYEESKNILKVSIPFGLASFFGYLAVGVDKLVVSTLGTKEEFAIFSTGAMEVPFIGMITGALTSVALVEMANFIGKGKVKDAVRLFSNCASATSIIIFPLFVYLSINSESLIIVLFTEKYSASSIPFSIYLLLLPIRIVIFSSIMIALGLTKETLYRTAIEFILNVALSLFLFDIFGPIGVAYATVISTYLFLVPFNLLMLSSNLDVSLSKLFNYRFLLKILVITICLSPIIFACNLLFNDILGLVFSLIMYAGSYMFVIFKYNFIDTDVKSLIKFKS